MACHPRTRICSYRHVSSAAHAAASRSRSRAAHARPRILSALRELCCRREVGSIGRPRFPSGPATSRAARLASVILSSRARSRSCEAHHSSGLWSLHLKPRWCRCSRRCSLYVDLLQPAFSCRARRSAMKVHHESPSCSSPSRSASRGQPVDVLALALQCCCTRPLAGDGARLLRARLLRAWPLGRSWRRGARHFEAPDTLARNAGHLRFRRLLITLRNAPKSILGGFRSQVVPYLGASRHYSTVVFPV